MQSSSCEVELSLNPTFDFHETSVPPLESARTRAAKSVLTTVDDQGDIADPDALYSNRYDMLTKSDGMSQQPSYRPINSTVHGH